MKSTIICCTDGSIYAESVYEHTIWAAKAMEAEVHVLHMLGYRQPEGGLIDFSGSVGAETQAALMEELIQLEENRARVARLKGSAILEDARLRMHEGGVRKVTVEQLEGELVENLQESERHAELLVIGKRGSSADFAKMHLGSNLERVVRTSRRPVLVASRKFHPVRQILIAYDGSASCRKAVDFICKKSLFNGLECHLVRVGAADAGLQKELEDIALQLMDGGMKVSSELVPGHPETVIAQKVLNRKIDLLVMGAFGHSRIRQLLLGSTTIEMIRTCTIPLLLFR